MTEVIVKFLTQTSQNYNYIYLTEWEFFDANGVKIPIASAVGYGDNGHSPIDTQDNSSWQIVSNLWDGNLAGDNFWMPDQPNGKSLKFVLANSSVPATYSWLTATGHAAFTNNQYAAFPVTWEITYNGETLAQSNPLTQYTQVPRYTQLTMGPFNIPTPTPPILSMVTAIAPPSDDTTPSFVFSSSKAGTIAYGGAASSTTNAIAGNNTITYNTLSEGAWSNFTITVTDVAGNVSSTLTIPAFVIDTTPPTVVSFVLADTALKVGETSLVTLTFSEAVTGFASADDITVVNGSLSTMSSTDSGDRKSVV